MGQVSAVRSSGAQKSGSAEVHRAPRVLLRASGVALGCWELCRIGASSSVLQGFESGRSVWRQKNKAVDVIRARDKEGQSRGAGGVRGRGFVSVAVEGGSCHGGLCSHLGFFRGGQCLSTWGCTFALR